MLVRSIGKIIIALCDAVINVLVLLGLCLGGLFIVFFVLKLFLH